MVLGSCGPQRPSNSGSISPGGATFNHDDGQVANWPFWPVSMNVHPLTRLTREDGTGRTMLEARVEFLDAQGNRSKAVGTMSLSLYNDAMSEDEDALPIHEWAQDLRDPALNQQHFDVVTRTYLLRLEVDTELLPSVAELRATFRSIDHHTMHAGRKIERRLF